MYDPKISEPKWREFWSKNKIYKFNKLSKKPVYSIDTPPPYASARHLHVGHAMHYSQFEFIARFQRMRGKNVFFPMGYDDNGLPTERYVEKKYHIEDKTKISKTEFIRLCLKETKETGQTYYNLFTNLGFSIDWNLLYQTIGDKARRIAQKSFLRLYKKRRLERIDQPAMWCTHCQTSIAQADTESIDRESALNDIIFKIEGNDYIIATTRPEMLPACVAVFYNPSDERYKHLEGKKAIVPLFNFEVPILSDASVEKDKGTGLMIVCTFGDKEDVEKWHNYKLPIKIVFDEAGSMNELAGKYQHMNLYQARAAIIEDLKKEKLLINQIKIVHAVNVHERCETDIEFLKKPQWQIKVLDKKKELINIAEKINWYPKGMKTRYKNWVKGLQWNWNISRQRNYGVPFPVWYCKDCKKVLLPKETELPVDPRENKYKLNCSCGSKNIEPEADVMDTWMTSSLTPEINADWAEKKERKRGFFPMSLRPQAHDIIRTWAFYTITKSYFHHNKIPWKDIIISGHGLDPKGQKMSKSKGNIIEPQKMIEKYSADCLRLWAASTKLGDDSPFQEKELVAARKFITKLWNASLFAFLHLKNYKPKKPKTMETMDKWILSELTEIARISTQNFDKYEYSKTKSEVENFFWKKFCDNYLEIIKDRIYNPDKRGKQPQLSAQYSLYITLLTIIKLIAPITPYITEEIYQKHYRKQEKIKSIHISKWPVLNLKNKSAEQTAQKFLEILAKVRQFKNKNNKPLNTEIILTLEEKEYNAIKPAIEDLKAVTKSREIKKGSKMNIEFIALQK